MAEAGRDFETLCVSILESVGLGVKREAVIKREYGTPCSGVDIMCGSGDRNLFIQCKWEGKTPSIRDVNHFIVGVQMINSQLGEQTLPFDACFLSRYKQADSGSLALQRQPGFCSIHADKIDNQKVAIQRLMSYVKSVFGLMLDMDGVVDEFIADIIIAKTVEEIALEPLYVQYESQFTRLEFPFRNAVNDTFGKISPQMGELAIKNRDIEAIYKMVMTHFEYDTSRGDINVVNLTLRPAIECIKQLVVTMSLINATTIAKKKPFKLFKFVEPTYAEYMRTSYFGKNPGNQFQFITEAEYKKMKNFDDYTRIWNECNSGARQRAFYAKHKIPTGRKY